MTARSNSTSCDLTKEPEGLSLRRNLAARAFEFIHHIKRRTTHNGTVPTLGALW